MHDKTLERSIDEIAETLKRTQRGATVLIGAGCSKTAGIPLASEFVKLIRDKWPVRCKRVGDGSYARFMDELGDDERHELIAPFIDQARVNWAHMAIAQMMKHERVSRILTTNFDPLIIQACAIAGIFPAVYDLASSKVFKPAQVSDPSVFFLHGQRRGFVMLHTDEQVESHFETLTPVLGRAGEGRVWIVVGYSGVNDPVFRHLAAVGHFGHNLYWVGYGDEEPPQHAAELISKQRRAYYVRGYDADRFFVELARALDCFPPDIISKPFSHLNTFLELLMPFPPMPDSPHDLKEAARARIQMAIDTFELGERPADAEELLPEALDVSALLLAGKLDEVLHLFEASPDPAPELRDAAAWAHVTGGYALYEEAKNAAVTSTTPDEVDRLWTEACGRYAEAVRIKPDKHDALNNWGIALADWAKTKTGDQADRLTTEACGRYAEAVRIKPDKHEALNNWGLVLADWAKTKTGDEADRLRTEACGRYAEAVRIKPDKHVALYNWGNALDDWAKTKTGDEADRLWTEACDRYAEAVRIKPDKHEALYNWGSALYDWAKTKTGDEADRLRREACDRYAEAVRIEPAMHDALHNRGIALADWANTKTGDEADRLRREACDRYAEAVRIKPDKHEALYSWGIALADWANTKTGDEADRLRREACDRYAEAVRIKPDKHEALYSWGNALHHWAKTKTGAETDRLWTEACGRYDEAVRIKPDMHEALNNWGSTLDEWARTKTGNEADQLWTEACSRYAAAFRIKPDKDEALHNWVVALVGWARTKTGDEADRLWTEACGHYADAIRMKPDMYEALYKWGSALAGWARTKTGDEADRLWTEACSRYAEAVRIKPDEHDTLNSWASVLIERAVLATSPALRAQLLAEAEEKCLLAEDVLPGVGSYNLACVHALRGDGEKCRAFLLRSREHGQLPARDHAATDPDFALFRDEPWFREILATA